MILYKYCGPARIDILKSGTIALSSSIAFNDPFELNPHITSIPDPVTYGKQIADYIKDYVMLCLADNRESLLMWAHYTSNHTGFLIGFDASQEILAVSPSNRHMSAVAYSHYKPAGAKVEDFTRQELFYWKSSEWAYEREWRIVDSRSAASGPPLRFGVFPFQFRPEAIVEIITGCRCSVHDEIQALLQKPPYEHVSLISAGLDREKYRLKFSDYPRSAWGVA